MTATARPEQPPGLNPPPATELGGRTLSIERNGINVIASPERRGKPSDLFWPWCAANVGVLGMGYAAYLLDDGVSFWQALIAGMIGIVVSFLLVGFTSLAGKRGSAPTMILSRAPFGVAGNRLPSVVSYLLLVGWETVTVVLAIFATDTIFVRLGWSDGNLTKIIAFAVVASVIAGAGLIGFDLIMKFQRYITIAMIVLTIGFMVLTVSHIHFAAVQSIPSGHPAAFIGALIFAFTGFGLTWANTGSDYSRYLPTTVKGSSVVGWTMFGSSIGPIFLVLDGLLLAGSSPDLNKAIGADPIGGLASILPTWYLIPFVVVALLGLVGGAVLDIYSSGLALLSLGLKVPRYAAVMVDAVIMVLGTIYVVWVAHNFLASFTGFLITLGVPVAGWTGVFLADMLLRRRNYAEPDLYDRGGRYGSANWAAVASMALGSVVGFGLVTNSGAGWLTWQGYLLGPFGLGGRTGGWAYSNLGVVVSLFIGFVGYLLCCRSRVAAQEAR